MRGRETIRQRRRQTESANNAFPTANGVNNFAPPDCRPENETKKRLAGFFGVLLASGNEMAATRGGGLICVRMERAFYVVLQTLPDGTMAKALL